MGNYKPGGTAVVIRDYLSGYVRASGADHTGLGRWSWYSVTGADGVCTRFLSGYAPSGSASSGDQTFYKQCLRYIQTKKLRTNPQRMFQDDLLSVIDVWLGKKDRVVLMMDANEHVLEGKLPKALAARGLWPAVHSHNGGTGPNTHFQGKHSIDNMTDPRGYWLDMEEDAGWHG